MIVVDTSVWVDYFNGRTTAQVDLLDAIVGREEILLGDLILVEVLQGFRNDRDFRLASRLLAGFEFREMVGRDLALESARNYRLMRSRGVTIRKTIDVLIATFCILNRYELLHSDRDFDPMAKHLGLRVAG